MDNTYKKRAGTSGISGQLYETKLITLLEFRLLHDATVQQFHLASNIDDIGAFDDVCVKIKIRGVDRPILAFLQAKHKDDDDTLLKYDLIKHFHFSFLKVKQKFNVGKGRNRDALFNGSFEDTECVFILYTNAKYYNDLNLNKKLLEQSDTSPSTISQEARKPYESPFASTLNSLVATGDRAPQAVQLDYAQDDIEFVSNTVLQEEIMALAEHFAKFVNNKGSSNTLNDEYMERYHVILAKTVVYIAEDTSEGEEPSQAKDWQWLAFRPDFFYSDDNVITIIRNKVYELVIKNKGKAKKSKAKEDLSETTIVPDCLIDLFISAFLSAPSAMTLSLLIGSHITNANGTLQFAIERPDSDIEKLEHIDITPSTVDEAVNLASARNMLHSFKLKVPLHFGNSDLTITGSDKKVEKRLAHLTTAFVDLCKTFIIRDQHRIVTIDESLGKGLLSCNGGIGGAVGNLLVYDELTKCLKFTEDATSLRNNARALRGRLISSEQIDDLDLFRFKVTAQQFPRLVFDCSEEAEGILSKLLIYEQQSNHHGVEEILQNVVRLRYNANNTHDLAVNSDIMLIYYHHEVQKWWMSQKAGTYLTKADNIYNDVASTIVLEPQMSALQVMFNMSKIKYFGYGFSENALLEINSVKHLLRIAIVTNIATLTTVKVIQCLKNKYVVLDFECILNLPPERFSALSDEIKQTEKCIVLVCEHLRKGRIVHKTLEQLTKALEDKKLIIVTNDTFHDTVHDYFASETVLDDRTTTLADLTLDSQRDIIKNTKVTFQGQEVNLDLIISDTPLTHIKGPVLDKIIHNEHVVLGDTLNDEKYEEVKHLYVERRISRTFDDNSSHDSVPKKDYNNYENRYFVRTFHDIKDYAVLLTAKPGMGKSTLLTHLSVNTKERDKLSWIVRINLLEYSEVFFKWLENRTIIDTMESLKFICQVVLKNIKKPILLRLIKGKAFVEQYLGDEWSTFELNMFLNSYNKRKLIILFDGFDEICPHYKDVVLNLLNVVKNYRRRNRMWVTCRPYLHILPDIEAYFGKCYEIEYVNATEQEIYLKKFWQSKLDFNNLNDVQLSKVNTLIDYEAGRPGYISSLDGLITEIYDHFYKFLQWHFPFVDTDHFRSDTSYAYTDSATTNSNKSALVLSDNVSSDNSDSEIFDSNNEGSHDNTDNDLATAMASVAINDNAGVSDINTLEVSGELPEAGEELWQPVLEYCGKFDREASDRLSSDNIYAFTVSIYDVETPDTDRLDLDLFFNESVDRIEFPAAPKSGRKSRRVSKFSGTPLLLYLVADYFVNLIMDNGNIVTKKLKINLPAVYEMFIKTKFKNILLQEKNKMDVYIPDVMTRYEKDFKDFVTVHKKLGALAIFGKPLFSRQRLYLEEFIPISPFHDEDLEFDVLMKGIKGGTEKTGLISHATTDNMPIFIHRTFTEYYAAEYIIDVYKNEKIKFDVKKLVFSIFERDQDAQISIWNWIDKKQKIDKDLRRILRKMESSLVALFLNKQKYFKQDMFNEEQWIRLINSTADDYEKDYFSKLDHYYFLDHPDEIKNGIREIEETLIDNMKPSLKKHFV